MKAKLLTRINALIATLVSLLGFTSCGNFFRKVRSTGVRLSVCKVGRERQNL